MKSPDYWLRHYVTSTDPVQVQRAIKHTRFTTGNETLELIYFSRAKDEPNILISQGSGGHAYVFAELAYHLHLAGYNVFVMPKHGGRTIDQLLTRHRDALHYIGVEFHPTIGVYSEGLGGYVAFYLALAHAPIASLVCQNSPAIMTEKAYHHALLTDSGSRTRTVRRRRILLPVAGRVARVAPSLPLPISSYLPWKDLVDATDENGAIERRLVLDGYLHDPDFDRWYPLSAIMSLLGTPPPAPLEQLNTPTMFMVASLGPTPSYITDLYHRLPAVEKKLTPINGSVYWMLSHPRQAAQLIHEWFTSTLQHR